MARTKKNRYKIYRPTPLQVLRKTCQFFSCWWENYLFACGVTGKQVFGCVFLFFSVYAAIIYIVELCAFAAHRNNRALSIENVLSYAFRHGFKWGTINILGLVVLVFVLYALFALKQKEKKDNIHDFIMANADTYGSAHSATEADLKGVAVVASPDTCTGPIHGQMDTSGQKIITPDPKSKNQNGHVLCVAPSRSGKTYCIVKPNIIQACRRRESVILTDPKGELYADTAQYMRENGYVVKRMDFKTLTYSHGWNPLKAVTDLTRANIFTSIIMTSITESNNIFYNPQLALLRAAVYRVAFGPDYPESKRTMKSVCEIISLDQDTMDKVFAVGIADIDAARNMYKSFKNASPNAYGNIITGLSSGLGIFLDPKIEAITSRNDVDLVLPGIKPCAYYLIMPDMHSTYRFLSSIFFSFICMELADYADNRACCPSGKLDVRVNFILDEFKSIGVLPDWGSKMSTLAGRGVNIWVILQNLDQLEVNYGMEKTDISSNCATQIVLGSGDPGTSSYFSDKSGDATIRVQTERRAAFETFLKLFHQRSTGDGKRKVLTPNEVETMDFEDCLLFYQGRNVLRAKKFPFTALPEYKSLQTIDVSEIMPTVLEAERMDEFEADEAARVARYEETHPLKQKTESGDADEAGNDSPGRILYQFITEFPVFGNIVSSAHDAFLEVNPNASIGKKKKVSLRERIKEKPIGVTVEDIRKEECNTEETAERNDQSERIIVDADEVGVSPETGTGEKQSEVGTERLTELMSIVGEGTTDISDDLQEKEKAEQRNSNSNADNSISVEMSNGNKFVEQILEDVENDNDPLSILMGL